MQADYKKARSDTPPMPGIEAGGSVLLQRGTAGHACPLGLHFWMAALELGLLLTRTQSDLTKPHCGTVTRHGARTRRQVRGRCRRARSAARTLTR